MLFASFRYILIFLPVVVCGAIAVRRLLGPRAAQAWVLAASIIFYAASNTFNLVYLVASLGANWLLARWIERTPAPAKKRILVSALVLNVAYLCLFKYLGFFASMLRFALPHGYRVPELGFPLGISFFTITQIMYLVDCYEDTLAAGSLFDHATFVAFFPYLISGPLGRAKRMRHQFGNFGGEAGARTELLARGVFLFALGLFKKAVFANAFAQVVTFGSTSARNLSAFEGWIFSIAYVMQVYFDFSGYSDMAIGSALMLGVEIPRNFDKPYSATSIIEFWQRWHISLTNFITSYLYTPILKSFSRRTLFTSAVATLFAMGIAGLWHGGAWTFVIWGFLHGAFLGINQYWRKKNMPHIPMFLGWLLTFVCWTITMVYFGADSVGQANARLATMFNPHHAFRVANVTSLELQVYGLGIRLSQWPLLAGVLCSIFGPSSEELGRDFRPNALNCAYAVGLVAVSFALINSTISTPFVYFRF